MWVLLTLTAAGCYLLWIYTYWARRGVPQTRPLPLLGDFLQALLMRRTVSQVTTDAYRRFGKQQPYVGMYSFWTPVLLLRDPDLVKDVLVQNFSSFANNELVVGPTTADHVLAENPFFLDAERWKEARSWIIQSLSPARVRQAFAGALDGARLLGKLLEAAGPAATQDGTLLSRRYTAHVAAWALFGIDGGSLKVRLLLGTLMIPILVDFFEIVNTVLGETGVVSQLKMLVFLFFPQALNWFPISLFSPSLVTFFRKLIKDSVEYRLKENIVRNDFVEYASKRCLLGDGRIDEAALKRVTAQAINSFIESLETSGLTIASILLHLAAYPDEQDKLRDELRSAFPGGTLEHDELANLPYLDQVMKETLRLFPPADMLRRRCTKACTLQSKDGAAAVSVRPGTMVYVSVDALHRDPALYKHPDTFYPDHFSKAECDSRPKCTFLSWGEGPRMCVGMRYANMQVKVVVASLVLQFEIRPDPQQQLPPCRDPSVPLLGFCSGVNLRFRKLEDA